MEVIIIRKIINWIRKLQRNNLFYVLAIVQVICLALYYYASKGLEMPGGITEVFRFLMNAPADYLGALVVGLWAWVISAILLISIIFEAKILKELLEEDYTNYYYYRRQKLENLTRNQYIINIVICLVLLVCNYFFLKFLLNIISVLLMLTVVVIFFIWASNNK